jgi:hypothetical protein
VIDEKHPDKGDEKYLKPYTYEQSEHCGGGECGLPCDGVPFGE